MNNSKRIKVLLANGHEIMREGLHMLFESQPDMEVLGGTGVGESVMQFTCELEPDVVVIDADMPETDSIELSRQILNEKPNVRIIALAVQLHAYVLKQAIKAGIAGFVLMESGFDELARAVRAVYEKRTYMCSEIKDVLANGYFSQIQGHEQSESSELTEREYEIIRLLSIGMTSKGIALRMDISSKTVDACRREIMHKLRIDSIAELVKHSIRAGITSI
jgi:DNA-binding NarL/FixJ family response regulator